MIDEGIIVVPKNGVDARQYMRNQPEAEKFDTRSSIRSFILSFILNGEGRGLGPEIDYIQRRLVLS